MGWFNTAEEKVTDNRTAVDRRMDAAGEGSTTTAAAAAPAAVPEKGVTSPGLEAILEAARQKKAAADAAAADAAAAAAAAEAAKKAASEAQPAVEVAPAADPQASIDGKYRNVYRAPNGVMHDIYGADGVAEAQRFHGGPGIPVDANHPALKGQTIPEGVALTEYRIPARDASLQDRIRARLQANA